VTTRRRCLPGPQVGWIDQKPAPRRPADCSTYPVTERPGSSGTAASQRRGCAGSWWESFDHHRPAGSAAVFGRYRLPSDLALQRDSPDREGKRRSWSRETGRGTRVRLASGESVRVPRVRRRSASNRGTRTIIVRLLRTQLGTAGPSLRTCQIAFAVSLIRIPDREWLGRAGSTGQLVSRPSQGRW
jgi:hypothetical protein